MSEHINDDIFIMHILNKLSFKNLSLIRTVNKKYNLLCTETINNKSIQYGGMNGIKYDFVFSKVLTIRNHIIKNLSKAETWDKTQLNMVRWSNRHMDIFGLYNLYNCTDIKIWLCD